MMHMLRRVRSRFVLVGVALAIAIGELGARVPILFTRRFDPDEFEHTHVAWYILHGQVPFRDFYEHHTPLFHYLLAMLLPVLGVEASPEQAMRALFVVRSITWLISVAVVVLTFVLARRLRDATTAWVSLALIAGNIVIALRAIEIRPDGLSTLLWLASLVAFHAGMTGEPDRRQTRVSFVMAGIALGLAVLTSQKLLFAGLPVSLLILWYIANRRFGGAPGSRFRNAAVMALGVLATWAVPVAYFWANGALGEFLRLTLFEGARWKAETNASNVLTFVLQYEPWLFAMTAGGVIVLLREYGRPPLDWASNVLLLLTASGTFLGLFLVPVPYPQYCLTFMPLFAIIAASFLVETARSLVETDRRWDALRPSGAGMGIILVFIGVSLIGLSVAKPIVVNPWVYPLVVAAGLVSLLSLPFHRRPSIAVSVVLVVLAVLPAQWMRWMAAMGDQGQFAELSYVLRRVPPGGMVLDGWSGYGVFRRHAGYYWMFHPGVRAMLPPEAVKGLVADLDSGRLAPDVVVLDSDLRALSTELVAFAQTEYEPTGVGNILVRRPR